MRYSFFLFIISIFQIGLYGNNNNVEYAKKTLKFLMNGTLTCYLSTDSKYKIKSILIGLIESEQEQIDIAMYTLTDKSITDAILKAHERKVKINIVTDGSEFSQVKHKEINRLEDAGINIYYYKQKGAMHSKDILFYSTLENKSVVWTGSFNCTYAASTNNVESIIISTEKKVFDQMKKSFYSLKQRCESKKIFEIIHQSSVHDFHLIKEYMIQPFRYIKRTILNHKIKLGFITFLLYAGFKIID